MNDFILRNLLKILIKISMGKKKQYILIITWFLVNQKMVLLNNALS